MSSLQAFSLFIIYCLIFCVVFVLYMHQDYNENIDKSISKGKVAIGGQLVRGGVGPNHLLVLTLIPFPLRAYLGTLRNLCFKYCDKNCKSWHSQRRYFKKRYVSPKIYKF